MNKSFDIKEELEIRKKEADEIIKTFLPKEEGYQRIIMEAMNYSVLAGGKRLRPILIKETGKIFKDKYGFKQHQKKNIEIFMAAIEMIHTYSLVHDDLPAMDNDILRRGKKTTHAKYGEAFGVLAGDALLNYAFETMIKVFSFVQNEDERIRNVKAMGILSKKAGIYGMIGGQAVDVEGKELKSLEEVLFLYEKKTACLIEAAMMIGAILSGAGENEVKIVERIGHNVGIAFQIEDDILDISGDSKKTGKSTGSDNKNDKVTYVSLNGLKKSKEDILMLTNEAKNLMDKLPKRNEFLDNLFAYLTMREA